MLGCKREIDAVRAGSDGGLRLGDRHWERGQYPVALQRRLLLKQEPIYLVRLLRVAE